MTERRGLLVTILLSLLFLAALEWRDPYFFQTDDNSDHFLPWYALNHRTLRNTGEPALVNWHQYLGQPHFSHGLTGVLYVPNYLFSWLAIELWHNPLSLIDWLVIGHLVAGTALLYVLLRAHDCRVATSVAGALCAVTLPFVVGVSRIWLSISINYFFLALSLVCLKRFEQARWGRALGIYAIGRALFVLHGNVQYVAYTALFEFVFIAATGLTAKRRTGRVLAGWFAGNVLAGLIALPLLWEMMQASSISWRQSAFSPAIASSWSISMSTLLAAQVGRFPHIMMEFSAQIAFIGVTLVGAAFLWKAVRTGTWRDAAPWLLTAGLAAILAAGWGSLFDLPVFDRFRWPFKFLLYAGWFGTVGVTVLLSRLEQRGAIARRVTLAALFLALVAQVWINFLPATFQSFARRRVTDRAQLLTDVIPRDGRVAALQPGDIDTCNLFTFNYATLTNHLSVSGYDPILSKDQWQATFGTGPEGFVPGPLGNSLMAWMIGNGVRYVLILASPEMEKRLQSVPGLSEFLRTDKWVVYRLEKTLPFAYISNPDGKIEGLRAQFRGNMMEVDVTGAHGRVVLNVFPMPDLRYRFDGGEWLELGSDEGKPFAKMRPDARKLEVTLVVPSFRWTVPPATLALLFCLGLCFGWVPAAIRRLVGSG